MACPDGLLLGFGLPSELSGAVCYLRSDFGQNAIGVGLYSIASGLLVATTETASYIVTAAHALYRSDIGRRAGSAGIWLGCNGPIALATRGSSTFFLPEGFESSNDAVGLDFAVIEVARVDPTAIPTIGISTSSADTVKAAMIVGYPTEDMCAGSRQPYHASLNAYPMGSNYAYGLTTYDGMSGSPLIARSSSSDALYSYGVHIRREDDPSGSQAVRFSADVVDQLEQWIP